MYIAGSSAFSFVLKIKNEMKMSGSILHMWASSITGFQRTSIRIFSMANSGG